MHVHGPTVNCKYSLRVLCVRFDDVMTVCVVAGRFDACALTGRHNDIISSRELWTVPIRFGHSRHLVQRFSHSLSTVSSYTCRSIVHSTMDMSYVLSHVDVRAALPTLDAWIVDIPVM